MWESAHGDPDDDGDDDGDDDVGRENRRNMPELSCFGQ